MRKWLERCGVFCGMCVAISSMSAARSADFNISDPLFSKMGGKWAARGVRTQSTSGRKVYLSAEVSSEVDARGRLVSWNRWTEISEGADRRFSQKTYDRVYWIRPAQAVAGAYELGMVDPSDPDNDSRVTAHGVLSGDGFLVKQILPPMRIESQTRFIVGAGGEETCETAELVFWQDRQISEAQIRFVRRR